MVFIFNDGNSIINVSDYKIDLKDGVLVLDTLNLNRVYSMKSFSENKELANAVMDTIARKIARRESTVDIDVITLNNTISD